MQSQYILLGITLAGLLSSACFDVPIQETPTQHAFLFDPSNNLSSAIADILKSHQFVITQQSSTFVSGEKEKINLNIYIQYENRTGLGPHNKNAQVNIRQCRIIPTEHGKSFRAMGIGVEADQILREIEKAFKRPD